MSFGFEESGFFLDLAVLTPLLLALLAATRRPMMQRLFLTVSGLYLLFVIAPRLALFFLAYWLLVALAVAVVQRLPEGRLRMVAFTIALAVLLAPMIGWKLGHERFAETLAVATHELLWRASRRIGELDAIRPTLLPVGLSWSSFRAAHLLVEAHLGLPRRPRLLEVLHYGLFPPLLVVGPISEWSEVDQSARQRGDLSVGLQRLVIGAVKIFVLAMPLSFSARRITAFESSTAPALWGALVIFAWYFYFNFSGYSDLAIGFARLFGYRLRDNFHHPFFQPTLREFWAHWHMSLTRFVQRYVFVPLGGFRRERQYFALAATMMAIALWHDVSRPLVLFGVYHACGLIVERALIGARAPRRPALGALRTFAIVMLSFPMLVLPWTRLLELYRRLFLTGWTT